MLRQHRNRPSSRDQKATSKLHARLLIDKISHTEVLRPRKQPRSTQNTAINSFGRKEVSTLSRQKAQGKENRAANEDTPKLEEKICEDSNSSGLDQLSQIKFVSKECSSIKGNSDNTSGKNILDFSPLFDSTEKGYSKEDFALQIEDIIEGGLESDSKRQSAIKKNRLFASSFDRGETGRRNSSGENVALFVDTGSKFHLAGMEAPEMMRRPALGLRSGRIKKNRVEREEKKEEKRSQENKSQKESWIEKDINEIFLSLKSNDEEYLSQSNCRTEGLQTQLNYLIGSILGKIKVTDKRYNFAEFRMEFRQLVADLEEEELRQIISSNKRKGQKVISESGPLKKSVFESMVESGLTDGIEEPIREISFRASPTFQGTLVPETKPAASSDKLSRITDKLSSYLLKNNLVKVQERRQDRRERRVEPQVRGKSKVPQRIEPLVSERCASRKTQGSGVKRTDQSGLDPVKVDVSLRNCSQTIKGIEGQEFSLSFAELNRHC